MTEKQHANCDGCPIRLSRRGFLTAVAASSAALKMSVMDYTASLFADEPKPARKPVIHAVFLRPKDPKGFWMTFTGPGYDFQARQAEFTKTMTDAAREAGAELTIHSQPLSTEAEAGAYLERSLKSPPDGFLVVLMCRPCWRVVDFFVEKRGQIPTVIFTPVGMAFTGNHAKTRNAPFTFQAATQDHGWLAHGVRMLYTLARMKQTRLCMLHSTKTGDKRIEGIGTTLHYIPLARWMEEFNKAETSDEMRAIADYYTKEAKKVIEPKPQDILNGARSYVVCRKFMAEEKCHGISVDCMRLVGKPGVPCGPCLAFSKLNDELVVGACETDVTAAISLLLVELLFQRPGFMQDPVPNTINNTLIGAHCSCPTKLNGPDQPHEPFILRADNGTNRGLATQVLWKEGQDVTVMKFASPTKMLLGTGRVVSNVDTTVCGGCRTSVEIEIDNMTDPRDCAGFHQLFVYGKLERPLRAFCQLAGIKPVPIV